MRRVGSQVQRLRTLVGWRGSVEEGMVQWEIFNIYKKLITSVH